MGFVGDCGVGDLLWYGGLFEFFGVGGVDGVGFLEDEFVFFYGEFFVGFDFDFVGFFFGFLFDEGGYFVEFLFDLEGGVLVIFLFFGWCWILL